MHDTNSDDSKMTSETITSVHWWTENLFSVTITRPAGYTFVAGQFSRLGLIVNGEMVWRAYSVTSAENTDSLEFYVIVVPDGLFTTALRALVPGDTIYLDKTSFGFMTADRFTNGRELWMLATGTGLGPFVSILHQETVWQQFDRLILVHGVRHASELTYQDTLRALADQAKANGGKAILDIVSTVTREDHAPEGCLSGRITTLLDSGALEKAVGLPLTTETSRLMLCGNPDMITQTRDLLKNKGFTPLRRDGSGQFVSENYWS
jgi:ferredoxin--NADP+ reductase